MACSYRVGVYFLFMIKVRSNTSTAAIGFYFLYSNSYSNTSSNLQRLKQNKRD